MAQSRPERRYKVPRTPTKSAGKRRQRIKVQKRRLTALGVSAETIEKLNAVEIRNQLRHPTKVKIK